ncbi:MAG: ion transporter, partial [Okeania sp. SIO1H6]|nr:ion transporter [Okeania sp. SIO1H6]
MSNSNPDISTSLPNKKWQLYINRFFQLPGVSITIGILIILSVILTLIELSISENSPYLLICKIITESLTILFAIELTLRLIITPDKKLYFQEYWLDILAILPLLRVFRITRALRLLRLVQILRLSGLFNRYTSTFPYILERGILEYSIVFGLLLLTIIFASVTIPVFESKNNLNFTSLE